MRGEPYKNILFLSESIFGYIYIYICIYILVSTSKASHVQYWDVYVDVTYQLHLTGYMETVAYIRV